MESEKVTDSVINKGTLKFTYILLCMSLSDYRAGRKETGWKRIAKHVSIMTAAFAI